MKQLATLILALAAAGCAFNSQYASTTSTNPTNGVVTTTVARAKTYAIGDARAVVDKSRASAGKTSSVGASGVNEDVTSTNVAATLDAAARLLQSVPR